MKKTRKNGGFTLIELLMVISIIGLISGVVLTALGDARSRARNSQRIQNIESIATALQLHITGTNNQLPITSDYAPAVCLGKSNCWPGAYDFTERPIISDIVKSELSASAIPTDPLFRDSFGDSYLYTSDSDPFANGAPPPPRASYLYWVMEGRQQQGCGRGTVHPNWTDTTFWTGNIPSYGCRLNLGPYR